MAASKHLHTYPEAVLRAVEAVVRTELPLTIQCASEREARALRLRLYSVLWAYRHPDNAEHTMHKRVKEMPLCVWMDGCAVTLSPENSSNPTSRRFATSIEAALATHGKDPTQ
jgi:DNA polymerase IIIc chi subunit